MRLGPAAHFVFGRADRQEEGRSSTGGGRIVGGRRADRNQRGGSARTSQSDGQIGPRPSGAARDRPEGERQEGERQEGDRQEDQRSAQWELDTTQPIAVRIRRANRPGWVAHTA